MLGTVFMLIGENSRDGLAARGREARGDQPQRCPAGVAARTVYDRTELVDRTIATVQRNLVEGALLVIAVLFAAARQLRARRSSPRS